MPWGLSSEHHLECQPNAGKFPARCDLSQRPRDGTGISGEDQLDPIRTVRASRGLCDCELQSGMRHRQGRQLGGCKLRQPFRGLLTSPRNPGCSRVEGLVKDSGPLSQFLDPVIGSVELGQPPGCPLRPLKYLRNVIAVLTGQGRELASAIGNSLLPEWVSDKVGGIARDVLGEVSQQVIRLGDPSRQLSGTRVTFGERFEGLARHPD